MKRDMSKIGLETTTEIRFGENTKSADNLSFCSHGILEMALNVERGNKKANSIEMQQLSLVSLNFEVKENLNKSSFHLLRFLWENDID